jgi:hypothetical protein
VISRRLLSNGRRREITAGQGFVGKPIPEAHRAHHLVQYELPEPGTA